MHSKPHQPTQTRWAGTYDYNFVGNVQFDQKPLEGVEITVSGNGYKATVATDADGKWKIGVPEKATYKITLDEDTLPKGVVVAKGGATIEAEFGLTNTKAVNFFLGEGERVTTSFFDQFVQRVVNGPQLRPPAGAGRDRRLADLRHDGTRRTSPTRR